MTQQRIFLIDRHALTRLGLRQLIETQPDLTVCGEADCCQQCLALFDTQLPDLVIVEALCPTGLRTDHIAACRRQHPTLPILVVSTGSDQTYAARLLRAGANGYLSKDHSPAEILAGIRQVLRGEICVGASVNDAILHQWSNRAGGPTATPLDQFSNRELEIFRLLGQGQGTRQIAQQLHLSISTVETYRLRLKEKLRLATGGELVRCAVRWMEGAQADYHI